MAKKTFKHFKKIKHFKKNSIIFLLVAFSIFFLDRIVKYYISNHLLYKIVVIPNVFEIVHQQNAGVAFGISIPYLIQLILFPILVVSGFYIIFKYLNFDKLSVLILTGIIFGGALSNFIDRIMYKSVVDYISISAYPVFNIADAGITIGIFSLLVFYGRMCRDI